MSSLEVDCGSLNATECILQVAASILAEIRQSNSEFNWDPASFIVTMIIGIIAAFFAGLAIVQGLLAAGPGRHKCSKYAIGSWAQFSTRRLDWSELRYRTVAQTPIIDPNFLLDHILACEVDGRKWDDEGGPCHPVHKKIKIKHVPKDTRDHFPATWLLILTRCGLDHPRWWKLKPQGTDYLPSDLAAAPAYSRVLDMITLVAAASHPQKIEITIDRESKAPSVQGFRIDLDFRTHPLLGMYGVFQAWDLPKLIYDSRGLYPKSQRTKTVIMHANGCIPLRRPYKVFQGIHRRVQTLPHMLFRSPNHRKTPLLCQCQPNDDTNPSSSGSSSHSWQDWCSFKPQLKTIPLDPDCSGLRFLVAEAPSATIFPWKRSGGGKSLGGLIVFSRLWSGGDKSKYSESVIDGQTQVPPKALATLPGSEESFFPDGHAFDAALEFVSRNLWGKNASAEAEHQQRPFCEVNKHGLSRVRIELDSIDRWTKNKERKDTRDCLECRIATLSYASLLCNELQKPTTLVGPFRLLHGIGLPDSTNDYQGLIEKAQSYSHSLSPSTKRILSRVASLKTRESRMNSGDGEPFNQLFWRWEYRDYRDYIAGESSLGAGATLPDVLGELCKLLTLWEVDEKGFKHPTDTVQHYLDDLLIYRAILIAILFENAVDNSDFLTEPCYNKMVPII